MRARTALAAALAAACAAPLNPADTAPAFLDAPPALVEVGAACDVEAAAWSFVARTDAWTGNGRLYVGRDAESVEAHPLWSTRAAADGSWDCLELDLDVVSDWRDATAGSSTRWRCADADELGYVLVVYERGGGAVADCLAWGAAREAVEAADGVPACDEVADTGVPAPDPCG